MSVKRYFAGHDVYGDIEMKECAHGDYASYEDYAALQQKLDAVESKLAELHKQEPVLFRDSHGCFVSKGKGEQLIKSGEFVTPYYIRPAPAINLAELVPDENEIERIYSIYCTQTVGSKNALRHIRNELLRKIEEVK